MTRNLFEDAVEYDQVDHDELPGQLLESCPGILRPDIRIYPGLPRQRFWTCDVCGEEYTDRQLIQISDDYESEKKNRFMMRSELDERYCEGCDMA